MREPATCSVVLRVRKHGSAAVHPRNFHIRLLTGGPSHQGMEVDADICFAAVIAVFVIAADFESSEIKSIWTELSFVVADAQSEPVAASNTRIALPQNRSSAAKRCARSMQQRF